MVVVEEGKLAVVEGKIAIVLVVEEKVAVVVVLSQTRPTRFNFLDNPLGRTEKIHSQEAAQ